MSYAALKYDLALSYFVKAVQTNPEASGASVRTAVALCCFKLEQFDRARLALEKSLAVDVRHPFCIFCDSAYGAPVCFSPRSRTLWC